MRIREFDASSSSSRCKPYTELDLTSKDGRSMSLLFRSTLIPKSKSNTTVRGIKKAVQLQALRTTDRIYQLCRDLFLPIGYPNSVAEGYLEYQFYDSLQGLCSYLRGVVSTSAVLSATGVGNAHATAMSAAMTWAVRDGLGMIGGLLFSYIASPYFDSYVKEFRLLADISNDIGLTLDMALPWLLRQRWTSSLLILNSDYLPSSYLVLTSSSMLCKVVCGMAAGATKGNITDHFAITGNRADCQAKESTQETLVSLVGMCCGVFLAKVLHCLENSSKVDNTSINSSCGDSTELSTMCSNNVNTAMNVDVQFISWSIFIFLTLIHVWANYIGMQMMRLRTLNRERAKLALHSLVEYSASCVYEMQNSILKKKPQFDLADVMQKKASEFVLPPSAVSESLLKSVCGIFREGRIRLRVRLNDMVRRNATNSNLIHDHFKGEKYLIFVQGIGQECTIAVMLHVAANERDELQAFVHAHILCRYIQSMSTSESTQLPGVCSM